MNDASHTTPGSSHTAVLDELAPLIGHEQPIDDVNMALQAAMRHWQPPVIGAMHITCSDESEHECIESFQRCFVEQMLPPLKERTCSPFRTSNLGARYEWQSLRIAEHHYATSDAQHGFKVMLVKVNGHVACGSEDGQAVYGYMMRYGERSACCGALNAVMNGATLPFAREIRDLLSSGHIDRLERLQQIDPAQRALVAAVVSARLHARSAATEAQDHQPHSPTVYLIVPAVTVNRPEMDTEILVGMYIIDRVSGKDSHVYRGLGDDPAKLVVRLGEGQACVDDGSVQLVQSVGSEGAVGQ
jgi:hypothetical protein